MSVQLDNIHRHVPMTISDKTTFATHATGLNKKVVLFLGFPNSVPIIHIDFLLAVFITH